MPSDSGDSRQTPKTQTANGGGAAPLPPPEQEHLPCPRCDSTNTKFCYYNNYNFSQPRHFCKSCRRYWTHGGTLRDIPVGGGSRKNAKRSRTCSSYTTAGITSSAGGGIMSSSSSSSSHHDLFPTAPAAALVSLGAGFGSRSFTSLLNNSSSHGAGFLALGGGFGLGLGHGFDDVGFGVGKGVWPFSEVGFVSTANGHGNGVGGGHGNGHGHGHGVMGGDTLTWQPESGGNGFGDGDCFSWPDLAISAPGNGLK